MVVRPYSGDPKPRIRVQNPGLLRELHFRWKECALCWSTGFSGSGEWIGLSLHHISKHPRDDEEGNLVMLCGHGTAGCHGEIEAWNEDTVRALGRYIVSQRGDTIMYIYERFGATAAQDFIRRHLLVDS